MDYEAVIGLEVHAQLLTESKIFCRCSTRFGAPPNTHTCPVCLGMPGVLPVLNQKALEYALRMALATNCRIASFSRFARKNYFYPDLPKGYQISQYELPLAEGGHVSIRLNGVVKKIGIKRIHMEEDAGKLLHDESIPRSYVDFNRTGVPLLEIVSEPEINSAEEAALYLKTLRDILVYLEICDGNMEEGSFRCDANISVRPAGRDTFGTRTELKNMNSFRNVQRALDYEIQRQKKVLEEGGSVLQETRLWDEQHQVTYSMRGKEEAHDYRYFPDPDLVPLEVDKGWIERIKSQMPELPDQKRERFLREYEGLTPYDVDILVSSRALADYFETTVKLYPKPKLVSNWITGDLLRELNREGIGAEKCPLEPERLAEMLRMLEEGIISRPIAQTIFERIYKTKEHPSDIVEKEGLVQVSDSEQLSSVVEKVLSENPKEVELYRKGKEKLFGFFMGQVMKETRGKADPQAAGRILKEKLKR